MADGVRAAFTAHERRDITAHRGSRGWRVFKSPKAWLRVSDDEAKLVLVNQTEPLARAANPGGGPGTAGVGAVHAGPAGGHEWAAAGAGHQQCPVRQPD